MNPTSKILYRPVMYTSVYVEEKEGGDKPTDADGRISPFYRGGWIALGWLGVAPLCVGERKHGLSGEPSLFLLPEEGKEKKMRKGFVKKGERVRV
jgi:hypothetical protein